MHLTVEDRFALRFDSGEPVRSASAVAPFGAGWLMAQDDAVHAAWWLPESSTVEPLRLLPDRDGHDVFAAAQGTKDLKPDLESACAVPCGDGTGVLFLGSGSLAQRATGVLVRGPDGGIEVHSHDLTTLYERVHRRLSIRPSQLNLEGACVVADRLRVFQRGHDASGTPSASVDLELAALLDVFQGGRQPTDVPCGEATRYDLRELAITGLAITDAVVLQDGRILVSLTAEDTPDPVADGPIAGSALAVLRPDGGIGPVARLPDALDGCKLEGLSLVEDRPGGVTVLAVMDQDDPRVASPAALVRVDW